MPLFISKRIIARRSSIGRLRSCSGTDILKLINPLSYSVPHLNFGGFVAFGGVKPTKVPVATERVTNRRLFRKLYYQTTPAVKYRLWMLSTDYIDGYCNEQLYSVQLLPSSSGGKMFDFRRITLFCLEKRLSKHKI